MNILEKTLEDLIFELITEHQGEAIDRGCSFFVEHFKYFRQVVLGNYGRCDILGFYLTPEKDKAIVQIIELKKDRIDIDTLKQAVTYAKGVMHMLSEQNIDVMCDIVLIGTTINTSSDFIYFSEILRNVRFYTVELDALTGLYLQRINGFKLIHPGFELNDNALITMIQQWTETQES